MEPAQLVCIYDFSFKSDTGAGAPQQSVRRFKANFLLASCLGKMFTHGCGGGDFVTDIMSLWLSLTLPRVQTPSRVRFPQELSEGRGCPCERRDALLQEGHTPGRSGTGLGDSVSPPGMGQRAVLRSNFKVPGGCWHGRLLRKPQRSLRKRDFVLS